MIDLDNVQELTFVKPEEQVTTFDVLQLSIRDISFLIFDGGHLSQSQHWGQFNFGRNSLAESTKDDSRE